MNDRNLEALEQIRAIHVAACDRDDDIPGGCDRERLENMHRMSDAIYDVYRGLIGEAPSDPVETTNGDLVGCGYES